MKIGSDTSQRMDSFFENINSWSSTKRLLICIALVVFIAAAFYFALYKRNQDKISKLETGLEKFTKRMRVLESKARQKDKFEKELAEAEQSFKLAMQALPDKKEIPSLLKNISKSGDDAGLEFLLFAPKPEQLRNFYAEIPVQMKVKGGYHDMAQFFETIARLPRIVNVRDINLAFKTSGEPLEMSCKAVTYKFVETPPEKDGKGKKKKK